MDFYRLKLVGLICVAAVLMSCSPKHDVDDLTGGYAPNPNPDPQLAVAAQTLLESRCQNCHSAGGTSTPFLANSISELADNPFYVQIGNPTASNLFIRASDGSMPASPQIPLTSSEYKIIEDWIADLGVFIGEDTSQEEVTFTQVWQTTFQPKCTECHAVENPPADISIKDYADLRKLINTSAPEVSLVYDALINNRMPKNNPAGVSAQEKADILTWIRQGGLDN